jgi:hypothetical protein
MLIRGMAADNLCRRDLLDDGLGVAGGGVAFVADVSLQLVAEGHQFIDV